MTRRGFWEVAALSRKTIGLFPTVRERMGKSPRMRATSSAPSARSFVTDIAPSPPLRFLFAVLLLDPELLADALVALLLELLGQLLPARLHDTPADHDVDEVRRDVVQDPLVMGDEEHAEVRPDQLFDPCGHGLQRVDIQARVRLVQYRDVGL